MNIRVVLFFFFLVSFCFSQDIPKEKNSESLTSNYKSIPTTKQPLLNSQYALTNLELSAFYGSILLHNADVTHLISKHPVGVIIGYNKKTFGYKEWEQGYNYPDLGVSFSYQDMNNPTLGENYGIYGHFNFYFFKRNMQFRIGQGIALTTNPYDKNTNFRNNAYGTQLLSSTLLMLNYHKEKIYKGLGFKIGFSLIHYSNANVKSPNTSTNTIAFTTGLVYNLNTAETDYIKRQKINITEPFQYSFAFRTGINESDVIGLGQFPFYIFSAYVDKRMSQKSAVQLGTDAFFSNFLKALIRFQSVSFPENNIAADTDFKRIGVFVGHELFINKLSVTTQLGYYLYYPFDFEGRVYNRIGLKRYFGTKWFGEISLKSHASAAEAVEFGLGIRL